MALRANQSHITFEGFPSFYARDEAGKTLITSNVDFCEGNFQYSSFVAEPVNTVTSFLYLFISVSHAWFLWKHCVGKNKKMLLKRFLLGICGSLMVGFGSSFLHASLTRVGQYADEIGMQFSLVVAIFMYMFREEEANKKTWWKWTVFTVLALQFFGHAYSMIWIPESYAVFVLVFAGILILSTIIEAVELYVGRRLEDNLSKYIHNEAQLKSTAYTVRRVYLIYFVFFLGGFILWCIEFAYCPYVYFLHLHGFWHLFTAISVNAKSSLWYFMTFLSHNVEGIELTYYDPLRLIIGLDIKEKK